MSDLETLRLEPKSSLHEKKFYPNDRRRFFIEDLQMSEPTNPNYTNNQGQFVNFSCNESGVHLFMPAIHNQDGVAIGVGLDQMFDLIANSKVDSGYIVDFLPPVSLTSRALCEVATHLFEIVGKYPNAGDIVSYFHDDKKDELHSILYQLGYESKQIEMLEMVKNRVSPDYQGNPISLPEYIQARMKISPNKSHWLDKDRSIKIIIDMYRTGRLRFVTADLAGSKSIKLISSKLQKQNQHVGFIYLSNAEMYIDKAGNQTSLEDNMNRLPVTSRTLALRSDISGDFLANPKEKILENRLQALFLPFHYTIESFTHWKTNRFLPPKVNILKHEGPLLRI